MSSLYQRFRYRYFARAVTVITVMIFLISLAISMIDLLIDQEDEPHFKYGAIMTLISWLMFALFGILCFAIRKVLWVQRLVCPLLTIYLFVLVILGEATKNDDATVIFAKGMIGLAASFYILVMFNEAWLINLAVFVPCSIVCLITSG